MPYMDGMGYIQIKSDLKVSIKDPQSKNIPLGFGKKLPRELMSSKSLLGPSVF